MRVSHVADISLPLRVYFRYGAEARVNSDGTILDGVDEQASELYAEGWIFHRDLYKSMRVLITRGHKIVWFYWIVSPQFNTMFPLFN